MTMKYMHSLMNRSITLVLGVALTLGLSSCYRCIEPESPPKPSLARADLHHPFEKQILAFKYSLYPDLVAMSDPFDLESPQFQALSQKVSQFVQVHAEAFRSYQVFKLQALHQSEVDLRPFQAVPHQALSRPPVPFLLVFLLDPGAQMMGQLPVYLLQDLNTSAKAMSNFYFQMGIGGLQIQSQPLDSDHWEVVIDAYSRAFRFHFDLNTGMAQLVNMYQRKSAVQDTSSEGATTGNSDESP
jgi:hypothetical protein